MCFCNYCFFPEIRDGNKGGGDGAGGGGTSDLLRKALFEACWSLKSEDACRGPFGSTTGELVGDLFYFILFFFLRDLKNWCEFFFKKKYKHKNKKGPWQIF